MKFGIDVPNSHPPVFKKKWNDYNKLNNNNNSNNNNSNDNNNINILESPPLLSLFTILIIIIHSTVTSLFSQQIWSPQVLLVFTMGSGPLQAHPVGMDVLPIHWTLIFFLLIPPPVTNVVCFNFRSSWFSALEARPIVDHSGPQSFWKNQVWIWLNIGTPKHHD